MVVTWPMRTAARVLIFGVGEDSNDASLTVIG